VGASAAKLYRMLGWTRAGFVVKRTDSPGYDRRTGDRSDGRLVALDEWRNAEGLPPEAGCGRRRAAEDRGRCRQRSTSLNRTRLGATVEAILDDDVPDAEIGAAP
jgi:hypothetical protein